MTTVANGDDAAALTGGCQCGAVRYRLAQPLARIHYCHCRMCQRAFGNVFSMFGSIPRAEVEFIKGAPKTYRSSTFAERGFCAECGTPLTFQYLARLERIGISVGSLDRPDLVQPEYHYGIESKVPWLVLADHLPQRRAAADPMLAELIAKAGPTQKS
ncbi:MAG: GFA family protein [Rhodospirillales bacterium]|nr:GFA family protein [Rhodospirillales bacterium]